MADDYLSLLSPNDLAGFNQNVMANDPYGLIGRSLAEWQPNYSTFNAGQSALTAFGKAFMGGLLQNYSQNRAADQITKVVNVLPQLRSDPLGVAVPEGVDVGPFNMLRGSAILKNEALKESDKIKDESRIGTLLNSILPEMVKARSLSAGDALSIATSDDPQKAFLEAAKRVPNAEVVEGPGLPSTTNPLAMPGQATSEKFKSYYQDFLKIMPPIQAASAAKEQVQGEIKANSKSFDEAKTAREAAQKLMSMAQTAEAGMSRAGQTGSELASMYEKTVATLAPILPGSQAEAIEQSTGDALLSSIKPEAFTAARPPGIGAMSDPEMRVYLGTAPGIDKTPEQNAALVTKIKKVANLYADYADFMDAYREANSGSTIGADKKWMEYRRNVPLFTKEGDIDEARPSWQEYFTQVGSGVEPQANTGIPNAAVIKAEAQALSAQGKSKEEISAYLRGKYGG